MTPETAAEPHPWPLIKGAMFTTHLGNGHLRSQPMTAHNRTTPDDKLQFFMSANCDPAQERARQPQANTSDAEPRQCAAEAAVAAVAAEAAA